MKSTRKPQKYMCFAITLFILLASNILGQSITWQRTYDGMYHGFDVAEDICDAGNGNFLIVGTSQIPNSYSSIYVVKINRYGDTLWTRRIDTAYGKAVTSTRDGGSVITGLRDESFSVRIDSLGNIMWLKKYSNNIIFTGRDVIQASDEGYIGCGTAYHDLGYIFKIDLNGNLQWDRLYSAGHSKYFNKIINANDSGYLIVGTIRINQQDTARGLVTKIDKLGNVVWENSYVVNANTSFHSIKKINNNYLVNGEYFDGSNFRIFFKRLDIYGNDMFTKSFASNDNEFSSQLDVINLDKYVISVTKITNTFPYRYYSRVLLTDSTGNITAENMYNAVGDLGINSILTSSNGDILFVGLAENYPYPVEADIYALRTDSMLKAPPIGITSTNYSNKYSFTIDCYPNPFNPIAKIHYIVPTTSRIAIRVFDLQGKLLSLLVNEIKKTGNYEVSWSPTNVSSGLYFLQLTSDNDIILSKKIVFLK